MLDKTIINGVDVSRCKYIAIPLICSPLCGLENLSDVGDYDNIDDCIKNPHCYYKQSTRKDERIRELEEEVCNLEEEKVNTLIGNGSYKTILSHCKKAKETTDLYRISEEERQKHLKQEKEIAKTSCSPMDFTKQQAHDFVKKQCTELRKIGFSKKLIEKWGFN